MFLDISTTVLAALLGLFVVLLGVLIWLRKGTLEIACKDPLFEPNKRAFLGQLDIAVRSHLNIFPSLPVTDVLEANRFSKSAFALNRVSKQRFDFVLCHRREMEVVCVIKLIPYGKNNDSKELSALREICDAAGLTMLEYEMKPYRSMQELRRVVFSACGIDELEARENSFSEPQELMTQSEEAIESEEEYSLNEQPDCPKCSEAMKRTTIKKGARRGQECWICSTYPECKGARLITESA